MKTEIKIKKLKIELALGNTHAWNNTDSGVYNAIDRGNSCKSYNAAAQEIANELGFNNIEDYERYASSRNWIYDLREELNLLQ